MIAPATDAVGDAGNGSDRAGSGKDRFTSAPGGVLQKPAGRGPDTMRSFRIDRGAAARVSAVAGVALLALVPMTFDSPAAAGASTLPSVSTGGARASVSAVVLEGSINSHGEAATYYFQYGPTVAYGQQTPVENLIAGNTAKLNVSQSASGLLPGYHYRLVASNATGETADGRDRTYVLKKTTTTTTKPKKSTKEATLKFTLSKPPAEGQAVGTSLTITGTLTGLGAAGHSVVLQSSPYPSSTVFGNVGAPLVVSSAGRFSFVLAHLLRSTRYRVAVVGPQPIYSPVITALATVRVTLHVRTAPRAGLVRLYGTVSPAVTGAIAFFQVQQPSKSRPDKPLKTPKNQKAEEKAEEKAEQTEAPKYATAFSAPVKRATKAVSRFSIVESLRKTGLYRVYVQVPKGPLAPGHSSTILLHTTVTKKGKSKS
jgi:hypothetical protein